MRTKLTRRALVGSAVISLLVHQSSVAQTLKHSGTPQATPAIVEYPPLPEVRDIQSRPWSLEGVKFSIIGEVTSILVAPKGQGWELGDDDEYKAIYQAQLIIKYELPNEESDWLYIGFNDDPVGVYEGDAIEVGGEVIGTVTGDTVMDMEHTWPLMVADYVRLVTPQT